MSRNDLIIVIQMWAMQSVIKLSISLDSLKSPPPIYISHTPGMFSTQQLFISIDLLLFILLHACMRIYIEIGGYPSSPYCFVHETYSASSSAPTLPCCLSNAFLKSSKLIIGTTTFSGESISYNVIRTE